MPVVDTIIGNMGEPLEHHIQESEEDDTGSMELATRPDDEDSPTADSPILFHQPDVSGVSRMQCKTFPLRYL